MILSIQILEYVNSCSYKQHHSSYLGVGWEEDEGQERKVTKGMRKCGFVEYVHYLAFDNGFVGMFMSKFIRLYMLNICNLLHINNASRKQSHSFTNNK